MFESPLPRRIKAAGHVQGCKVFGRLVQPTTFPMVVQRQPVIGLPEQSDEAMRLNIPRLLI